jgi:hypothetical protein
LSKLYFNKILKNLLEDDPTNTKIICDYISSEQTGLNIKDYAGGKIRALDRPSNIHEDKSLKEITKQNITEYLNNLQKSNAKAFAWI